MSLTDRYFAKNGVIAALISFFALSLPSSFANEECLVTFENLGPKGHLMSVARPGGGSTGGRWMIDENNTEWFVKADVHYPELQTSAEPIAAQIYRHFGYQTPATAKRIDQGKHYSASRDIGKQHTWTDFSDMNTPQVRQMRVVAAYLKDWDRLGNPSNNRKMRDGTVIILDFGGTLGSRAQGRHKPGSVVSNAIGSFEATTDIRTIYSDFFVDAPADHPWMQVSRADAEAVIEKFKLLTDAKIERIVTWAQYSDPSNHQYMVRALKLRRDGIVSHLLELFP